MSKGYAGLWIDDVNMEWRISNGTARVQPVNPRTGATMTLTEWRKSTAEFVEQIRDAFPSNEIAHNGFWFAGVDDPYVQRQLLAADYLNMERGINDGGIRGGGSVDGKYGFNTLYKVVDWLHAHGRDVIWEATAPASGLEYGLAAYFLTNNGADLVGNHIAGSLPDAWWPGNDVSLGAALGPRYLWNGVWRRDFVGGMVLVNPPESSARTLELGGTFKRIDAPDANAVTLGAASGAVLRSSSPPPPPTPSTAAPTTKPGGTTPPTQPPGSTTPGTQPPGPTTPRPTIAPPTIPPAPTTVKPAPTTVPTPYPNVLIISPGPNQVFGSTLKMTARPLSDRPIVKVEFYMDGKHIRTDSEEPYHHRWKVPRGFPRGEHTLMAKVYDAAGRTATASVVVVKG
jgi:hypothetical protein